MLFSNYGFQLYGCVKFCEYDPALNNEKLQSELIMAICIWRTKCDMQFRSYLYIHYPNLGGNIPQLIGWSMVFNATFNNISVISWRSVLLVKETKVPGKNHRPVEGY